MMNCEAVRRDTLPGYSGRSAHGGNGRDYIWGSSGADDVYGVLVTTRQGERDGSADALFFKSDQFAFNWLYGRAAMNLMAKKSIYLRDWIVG